ncbi:MAG: polysaccharide biosynthesis/export family protein [Candidatus Omnitrophica bacterium]|nr:polysaccharide biosynthesis/export family protein [Candidatus Omnitrophota bacterium]
MLKNTLIAVLALFGFLGAGYCQDRDLKADAKMHYDLGNIFYQQGRFEEAQQEYQRAMDILKTNDVSSVPAKVPAVKEKLPVKAEPVPAPVGKIKPRPAITEYAIGEEDILKISVWQNPDLDQEAIVRPDGMISFPLIGDVEARGLTITGLTQEITRRLSEFVKSPQVSISLKKMGGSKVIVLGEIMRPGVYSVTGSKTVLEAIGQAGGFSKDAVASSIVLIRGGFIQPQPQRLNLSKALKGRDVLQQNVALQAEDIIFVPKKFIADLNYFLTQVLDPLAKGAYTKSELQSW